MGTAAKPTRKNRTITVNFQNEATYFQLLGHGKAFLDVSSPFAWFWLPAETQSHLLRGADASRAIRIMRVSGWVGSPSGASSARRARRYSPKFISIYGIPRLH